MKNLNEVRIKNRFKVAMKRANSGIMSGQDIKAIVEYQLKEYVNEGDEPFTDVELALMACHMMTFN